MTKDAIRKEAVINEKTLIPLRWAAVVFIPIAIGVTTMQLTISANTTTIAKNEKKIEKTDEKYIEILLAIGTIQTHLGIEKKNKKKVGE